MIRRAGNKRSHTDQQEWLRRIIIIKRNLIIKGNNDNHEGLYGKKDFSQS